MSDAEDAEASALCDLRDHLGLPTSFGMKRNEAPGDIALEGISLQPLKKKARKKPRGTRFWNESRVYGGDDEFVDFEEDSLEIGEEEDRNEEKDEYEDEEEKGEVEEEEEELQDMAIRLANDEELCESIRKRYWHLRKTLFSMFDEGIQIDAQGWYSVTPEKLAMHHAERCRSDIVVDGFCGIGGNAIQLAFTCHHVIAIDTDPQRIAMAKHNAELYGVADRIEFILGDFLAVAPTLQADAVFLSPPWGGPDYKHLRSGFDINMHMPVPCEKILQAARCISPHIALFVPRNCRISQLIELAEGERCEIERNHWRSQCRALTVYFGELVIENSQ